MVAEMQNPVAVLPEFLAQLARVDEFEKMLVNLPPAEFKHTHRFTPGLYIREIFMPKGSIFTSKIQKTVHPYVISQGRVAVWTPQNGWERFMAPWTGITEPMTKRILIIEEDTIWTTFHVTDKTDILEIEKDIIFQHDNPLLTEEEKERVPDADK